MQAHYDTLVSHSHTNYLTEIHSATAYLNDHSYIYLANNFRIYVVINCLTEIHSAFQHVHSYI